MYLFSSEWTSNTRRKTYHILHMTLEHQHHMKHVFNEVSQLEQCPYTLILSFTHLLPLLPYSFTLVFVIKMSSLKYETSVVHTLLKNELCCWTCGRYTLESIIKSKHRSNRAPPAVFIIKFKSKVNDTSLVGIFCTGNRCTKSVIFVNVCNFYL